MNFLFVKPKKQCGNCGKIKSTHKGKWCDVEGLEAIYPFNKQWDSKIKYWMNTKICHTIENPDGLPKEDFQWKEQGKLEKKKCSFIPNRNGDGDTQ